VKNQINLGQADAARVPDMPEFGPNEVSKAHLTKMLNLGTESASA
jgi:hypothetical protein